MRGRVTYDFSGGTVVVAGATGALGGAVVRAYLESGARVVAVGRARHADLPDTPALEFVPLDVRDEGAVGSFFSRLDALDVLANVVGGYAAGQQVAELDLATLNEQLDLNLRTAFLLTKHALRRMQAQAEGKIVHVASRAAVESGKQAFAYSASKQAVVRLVEAAAAENREAGITVNCILPSIIDTPTNRAAMPGADHTRWPKPEELARVMLFLTSPDSALISGAAIPVYGRA